MCDLLWLSSTYAEIDRSEWRTLTSSPDERRVGVADELECHLREPDPGRRVDHPPNRVLWSRPPPVALPVRLARDLDPEVGVDEHVARVQTWPYSEAPIRRVAPVLRVTRRVIGRRGPWALSVATG